jgi:RNA polymerase sigma-70 factor (ECF subfamily)
MSAENIHDLVCRLARAEDPRALEVLFDAFAAPLTAFLEARLEDRAEAEDVVQQMFLDLARRPRQLLAVRRLEPWLFVKARHLAVDRLRARARAARRAADAPAWIEPVAPPVAPERADEARLAAAVARLPPEQREVIVLKVLQDRTFAETAEMLGVPANTAASRYRYALEKLREWMGEGGGHES